ncbi:importin-4 protein [Spatholobus suberectus]|nr:importin-4 protein [Spatholobus suberectus]
MRLMLLQLRPRCGCDLHALLLECLQDETSSCVRVAALKAVGSFLEFTHDGDEVLVDETSLFLRDQSACQQIESDSEIDDDDDSTHDEVLMDAVVSDLSAFAKFMGAQFAPIFG